MRRYFLYAALFSGLALVVGTELLSAFHFLNRFGVLLYWGVVFSGVLTVLYYNGAWNTVRAIARVRIRACRNFVAASPWRAALFLALCAFVATIGIIAWYAPPNTYDSLTYHMARVAHWQQNASVAIYPTAIARQYEYPAFSEYAILHLQLLTGGDRLANFVQFGAYLGCILSTSLIAQAMGLSGDGQLLAGVAAASLPMAVIQASGTQTDLVAAFWVSSAVYWILVAEDFSLRRRTLLVSASLALAAFVKFPGLLFAAPVGLWYALRVWQSHRSLRTLVAVALVLATLLLLVQGPFLTRRAVLSAENLRGNRSGGISSALLAAQLPLGYMNRRFDGAAVLSNTVRNLALHVGLPVAEWNAAWTALVRLFHARIGISENDDATTYPARSWHHVKFYMHEDEAGNLLHLLLAFGAVVWTVAGRNAASRRWREYTWMLTASAALFILALKWQMWDSRLHTVLFMLAAPLIAAWLANVTGARGMYVAAAGLMAAALPWLFWGAPRPLLGEKSVLTVSRETQYFANLSGLQGPMESVVAYVQARDCHSIGLWWGGNDAEYPLFALLHARDFEARLEQLHVTNASQILWATSAPFRPCLILAYNLRETFLDWNGARYRLTSEWEPLRVYESQP